MQWNIMEQQQPRGHTANSSIIRIAQKRKNQTKRPRERKKNITNSSESDGKSSAKDFFRMENRAEMFLYWMNGWWNWATNKNNHNYKKKKKKKSDWNSIIVVWKWIDFFFAVVVVCLSGYRTLQLMYDLEMLNVCIVRFMMKFMPLRFVWICLSCISIVTHWEHAVTSMLAEMLKFHLHWFQ